MNTHELLEMASLDAMGLLDTEEREAFERAFRAAPPAVQAQIRREQLRLSSDDMLPQVETPLGLRARVLAAVREAVGSMNVRKLEPAAPALRPTSGVHRFWRTGAIGALAACVVLGYSTVHVLNERLAVADTLAANAFNDHLLGEYGARFDAAFFDSQTRMVSFAPAAGGPGHAGRATMLLDPVNRRAQLFCKDMPVIDGEYEVVVVGPDGKSGRALLSFRAPAAGIKQQLLDGISLEASESIAIRRAGDAEVVLMSRGS